MIKVSQFYLQMQFEIKKQWKALGNFKHRGPKITVIQYQHIFLLNAIDSLIYPLPPYSKAIINEIFQI